MAKNYYEVEMEVEVRKYSVDTNKLITLLKDHKGTLSNKQIAQKLNKPITLVEHWFRNDKYFSIPDADEWYQLKKMLGINTCEFDQQIVTFVKSSGNYDMRNRIYIGDKSPALQCGCGNNMYLIEQWSS